MINLQLTESQLTDLKTFLSRVVIQGSEVPRFMSLIRALPKSCDTENDLNATENVDKD